VEHWDVRSLSVEPHHPQILHSDEEGRTIALQLPAGEMLQEHEVHERAWVIVVDGEVEISEGGQAVTGGAGMVAIFDPGERHEVRARSHTRLLLVLAPWPGKGHPRTRQ
jgi:quercetin dioxygenase-like cupin family protein